MSSGEEAADIAAPLNSTGASNAAQPPASSQPASSTARTANTPPSGPNTAPPRPTRAPAGPTRAPAGPTRAPAGPTRARAAANRPPAQPTRTAGPIRGIARPNTRPGANSFVYKIGRVSALRRYCVPVTTAILVVTSLVVIGILIKVVLDNYYFFCTKSFKFISLDKWCDGKQDCSDNQDEQRCIQRVDFSNNSIVRLTDSASIVQVFASGRWNSICYDGFDATRAKAVCAELGYASDASFSFVGAGGVAGPFGTLRVFSTGIQVTPINGDCPSGNVVSLRCITCGVNRNKERIVGGQDSPIENTPWQVSVQYMGQHSCGGSILSPCIILCAAHCFPSGQHQVDRWRVQAGSSTLTYLFASPVDEIFIHSRYQPDLKMHDIAMLKLKNCLSFSDTKQPVCLPGYDIVLPDDTPLLVSGWGHTTEGGTTSSTLKKVNINLISSAVCNQANYVASSMMCAGRLSGGLDTCQGDSGGPLVYLSDDSRNKQVGIVSFGQGCARPGQPGVYTRVSYYLPWIHSLMKSAL